MSVAKDFKKFLRRRLSVLHRDRPALLTFLFHSLFKDQAEIDLQHVDPQQCITVDHMRQFLSYFKAAGYEFIGSDQLDSKLSFDTNYVLITFDDGYYNNTRMLDLLNEFDVPAVFFIATGNVQNQECFWWDVVHRERHRQGWSHREISREQKALKKQHHDEIHRQLITTFGDDCFQPWSDIDRPMTCSELQQFSAHPLVHIGNHTSDHFILDNYPAHEVVAQITGGQRALEEMLDFSPEILAYPNGNYSVEAIRCAKEIGLKYAVTLNKHKNYLPFQWDSDNAFMLGRFTLWGTENISAQCDIFRSDLNI